MSDSPIGAVTVGRTTSPATTFSGDVPVQVWVAASLAFLLLSAPRARLVVGAPIYFIDVLAALLLVIPLRGQMDRWVPRVSFTRLVSLYLLAITISEVRGMIQYGIVLEPLYMVLRYAIAVSLFYTVPRVASRDRYLDLILKGILVGTLASASVVILYSLGPTRDFVVNVLFNKSYLNPGWESLVRSIAIFGADEAAMRGRSLVGAATMTAGFLSVSWPLSFLCYQRFESGFFWKMTALITAVAAPVAILSTYGRGAWLMVSTLTVMLLLMGLANWRKVMLALIAGAVILLQQVDFDRSLFYVDRLVEKTQATLDSPMTDVSTSERLLSFVEPFDHLAENPAWWIAGAGRTGDRVIKRGLVDEMLYSQGSLATHSGFSAAYYSFGVLGVTCQVLFIVLVFRFILSRLLGSSTRGSGQRTAWRALLMSWSAYSLWWASGHAMVGEPRGAMLSFFLMGLIVAFEKLRLIDAYNRRTTQEGVPH